MFARQQAAALNDMKKKFGDEKLTLVAIGSGTCDQAKSFLDNFGFDGEMYVDPTLRSYKAFGLYRGFWRTLGPKSLLNGLGALRKGFRQGKNAGDLWQQGGMFVIGPGNQILYEHRDKVAGDHADCHEMMNACPL